MTTQEHSTEVVYKVMVWKKWVQTLFTQALFFN